MKGRELLRSQDGSIVLANALEKAGARPDPLQVTPATKIKYAVEFADSIGASIAESLRLVLTEATSSPKRAAGSVRGPKQLDVNYSTSQLGLGLGISLKSVHLRDTKTDSKSKQKSLGRFTHNMKRNEEELRVEATGYHKRQPYAVMIACLFLPFDSCDDAKGNDTTSSFASFVRHLRPYCGRVSPADDADRFEKIYVALYQPDGSELKFFDIENPPPKKGRPAKPMLNYGQWLDDVYQTYLIRNNADFEWDDGTSEPLDAEDLSPMAIEGVDDKS